MDWFGNLWNWFDGKDIPVEPVEPVKPVDPVKPVTPTKEFETALLKAHNAQRSSSSALVLDDHLGKAAQLHATWMAQNNNMNHNEGRLTVADRAKAAGYSWNYVGENIAMGYKDVTAVMAGWMKSPGHRANIINRNYKDVGFGMQKSQDGSLYWCAVFGSKM